MDKIKVNERTENEIQTKTEAGLNELHECISNGESFAIEFPDGSGEVLDGDVIQTLISEGKFKLTWAKGGAEKDEDEEDE